MRLALLLLFVVSFAHGAEPQLRERGFIQPNSSMTPLDNGSAFTGTWQQADNWSSLTVKVLTDQAGALQVDFSDDCENETNDLDYEVAANIPEVHRLAITSKCFRVYFLNDSGANQTSFDLQVLVGEQGLLTAPYNLALGLDSDALATRPSSFQDEVRIGRRTGITGWTKFGYRNNLTATNGDETVWATTGSFTPLTSAETFTITYDGTGGGSTDGAGTNGATQLTFYYIDSSGNPAISAHTLETDGSDVTSFSGLGINRVAVSATGTGDVNASAITITATTAGTTQAIIPAGNGVTQQAIFFNGANQDAVIKYIFINVSKPSGGNADVEILGWVYNRSIDSFFEIFRSSIDTSVELTQTINEPVGFTLSPKDVLYFTADTGTNAANIRVRFSLNTYNRD